MRGVLVTLVALVAPLVVAVNANADTSVTSLQVGSSLAAGVRLTSPNAKAFARIESDGRLVVRRADGSGVWGSPKPSTVPSGLTLRVTDKGNLVLAGAHVVWSTQTAGSGAADVLVISDTGVLSLKADGLAAWTSKTGNLCTGRSAELSFVVDISRQLAAMCQRAEQMRVTPVTTGMSAYGYGTPTGTWHVQAKVRNTRLYPAARGAYPVKYWVPYDGVYGVHDSPWQTFAYGSDLYRTKGSHGCVHLPATAMAWLFSWVHVGTQVTVHQ